MKNVKKLIKKITNDLLLVFMCVVLSLVIFSPETQFHKKYCSNSLEELISERTINQKTYQLSASGMAQFTSSNQSTSMSPTLTLVLKLKSLITPFGAATPYAQTAGTPNCFGYALGKNLIVDPDFDSGLNYISINYYYQVIIPIFQAEMSTYGYYSRVLTYQYNSMIYKYERRIAFRIEGYQSNHFGDFHFMKQHDDGTWSHKPGIFNSIKLLNGENPENVIWSAIINYNSPTVYFAIY